MNLSFHPQGRSVNDALFERQKELEDGVTQAACRRAAHICRGVGYACRLGSMVHFAGDTRHRLRRDTNKDCTLPLFY